MKFTDEQIVELSRLKSHFPFRIVYGAISPEGKFDCGAVYTMRVPNGLARKGWYVSIVSNK